MVVPSRTDLFALLLLLLLLLLLVARHGCSAFVVSPHRLSARTSSKPLQLASESNDDDDDDDDFENYDGGNLDDLRKILESSWNAKTMGNVPTDENQAAEEAGAALSVALNREPPSSRMFFVDLLLPQYDITAGSNLYDEVRAVEFCIALANQLESTKTQILVRDGNILNTVKRILSRRAEAATERQLESSGVETQSTEKQEPDPSDDLQTDSESSSQEPTSSTSSDDVDSFRKQLMSSWEAPPNVDEVPPEERIDEEDDSETNEAKSEAKNIARSSEKFYRLASLFGDADIAQSGSDLIRSVTAAVAAHALPKDDEDTIIILSPVNTEELIALRILSAKYKDSRTIILVNCKLDPIPKELLSAQTVYSILPLIAQPKGGGGTDSNKEDAERPRVVVMRRYPRDWEVYVDYREQGFDLAASIPPESAGHRGPGMEWVASSVQRYLESR